MIAYLELRGIPNFFPRYLRDRRFPSRFNNERKIADREIYNLFVDWLQGASEDLAICHLDTRPGHLVFRDLVEKFLPTAVFPYTRESGLDQELKHLTFNPDQESIPHFFNRLRSIALKLRAVSTNKNENGRQSAWNGWQTEGDTNHRVLLAAADALQSCGDDDLKDFIEGQRKGFTIYDATKADDAIVVNFDPAACNNRFQSTNISGISDSYKLEKNIMDWRNRNKQNAITRKDNAIRRELYGVPCQRCYFYPETCQCDSFGKFETCYTCYATHDVRHLSLECSKCIRVTQENKLRKVLNKISLKHAWMKLRSE